MDFTKIRNYLFLGALLCVTVVFFAVLKPFAYPIFWAAVMAAMFYPFFKRINKHLRHPNLSALITLVAVAIIIIIPLMVIATLLVREALLMYGSLNSSTGQFSVVLHNVADAIKNNPYTAKFNLDETFWVQKFSEISQLVVNYILTALRNITQNSFNFLLMFVIMLYALFFFIRDGEKMLKKIMYLCPLGDRYEIKLYEKFTGAAGAIIKGSLIMGLIQGTVGGITFWMAGIEGAIIWALVMALASFIPGIGTAIVWVPAAIILILSGQTGMGIMVLLVGILIISTIDNLLRPVLVGKNLDMPALFILFSTIGGIAVFGFSGFMIGPIIAALFIAFWEMYEEYYRKELNNN